MSRENQDLSETAGENIARMTRLKQVWEYSGIHFKKDFAVLIPIRPESLSKLLSGRNPVTSNLALHVELAFGVSADWLLEGSGPMYAPGKPPLPRDPSLTTGDNPGGLREETVNYDIQHLMPHIPRPVLYYLCPRCSGTVTNGMRHCPSCANRLHWLYGA